MMSLLNIYATSPRCALFANSAIFLSGTYRVNIRQKKKLFGYFFGHPVLIFCILQSKFSFYMYFYIFHILCLKY